MAQKYCEGCVAQKYCEECVAQKTLELEGAATGTHRKLFILVHCLWCADLSTGTGDSVISMILHNSITDVDRVMSCRESTLHFLHWLVQFSPYNGSEVVSTELSPDAVVSLDWFKFHTLHFHPLYRTPHFSSPPQYVHGVCARDVRSRTTQRVKM